MPPRLLALIEKARDYRMTEQELQDQAVSFAYGNAHHENARITREGVARHSLSLRASR